MTMTMTMTKTRYKISPLVLCTFVCLIARVFIGLNTCILRALLYSLEHSFKHRGLTSGGVFGQASYEAKNLLCKYINCGSQVVFVTKKHLPPLPAYLDGYFFLRFRQKKIIIVQKT